MVLALAPADAAPVSTITEDDDDAREVQPPAVVRLRYDGATPQPEVRAGDRQPGVVHLLLGNDRRAWRTNVPTYAGITYQQLYPGIDLRYDGTGGQLKGTYLVAPHTDPSRIRWRYHGAIDVQVDATTGNLQISVPLPMSQGGRHILTEHAPIAWQERHGERVPVEVSYTVARDHSISFTLGAYDRTQALIIDPILTYNTYLGGSNDDEGYGIVVDSAGNSYITGYTWSSAFPTQNPVQGTRGGNADVFVSKLNAAGDAIAFSTYLGGTADEQGRSIALDAAGRIILAGETESSNFPLANPLDSTFGGGTCSSTAGPCDDLFIAQLSTDGSSLLYSTYLGGANDDEGHAVAVSQNGRVAVTGWSAGDFPTTANTYDSTHNGGAQDVILVSVDPTAASSGLQYSTYLGGSDYDAGTGIAIDPGGNLVVSGWTHSSAFPIQTPYQATRAGRHDVFVSKIDPVASGATSLRYSTFLGGSDEDRSLAITVGAADQVALTGYTHSTNFPTVNPVQAANGGGTCGTRSCSDIFVTQLDLQRNALVSSTYLGGNADDQGRAIARDALGNAYLTGSTKSTNFPLTTPLQAVKGGDGCSAPPCTDAFVTVLKAGGNQFAYSSYLGGSGDDAGLSIAVDAHGSAYLTGTSASSAFSTTAGAFDTSFNGKRDAFVVKLTDTDAPTVPTNLRATNPTDTTVSLAWDASTDSFGVTGYTISNGTVSIATSTSTSTTITGLTPGSSYDFTVRAQDAAGNRSLVSNTVTVVTPDSQPPTAPTNLHTTARTDTTLSLVWDAASDNGRIVAYEIYQGTMLAGSTPGTTFTVAGLTAGSSSSFTVKAKDGAGNLSLASAALTATTNTLPTTSLTTPASSTTVHGTVTVAATASDETGVALVEFYVDGVRVADDATAPYSVAWNTLDPKLPAYDGPRVLTTKVYDTDGQVTTSTPVSVTVANTSGRCTRPSSRPLPASPQR